MMLNFSKCLLHFQKFRFLLASQIAHNQSEEDATFRCFQKRKIFNLSRKFLRCHHIIIFLQEVRTKQNKRFKLEYDKNNFRLGHNLSMASKQRVYGNHLLVGNPNKVQSVLNNLEIPYPMPCLQGKWTYKKPVFEPSNHLLLRVRHLMILRMMPNFSKCFVHFQKFIFLPCSHQSKHYLPNLKVTKQTYKNICETQANRSSIMRSVSGRKW